MTKTALVDHIDALEIETMASGFLCLAISTRISWEDFEAFAALLSAKLGLTPGRRVDGPEMRIWEVEIAGTVLKLVWDDFPAMVSLESADARGDAAIHRAFEVLRSL